MTSQVNHPLRPFSWLLLVHRLPAKPDYLRVKVRRRLDRIGALAIKNSVYVLPDRGESAEDFQWLALEIQRDGGEVLICRSELIAGASDEDIVARFNAARDEGYGAVTESAAADLRAAESQSDAPGAAWRESVQDACTQARRRLDEIARIDFFGAGGRAAAEEQVRELENLLQRRPLHPGNSGGAAAGETAQRSFDREPPAGATWVTRAGVFVDRMASAWLIRRFIDREASFRFVRAPLHPNTRDEIRFDMIPAEYTHEGDKCTFEVLAERFGIHDPGVAAIAEVVHDIDLKDEKFARPEAAGVEAVLTGIVHAVPDDDSRLTAAFPLFDALYDRFRASKR